MYLVCHNEREGTSMPEAKPTAFVSHSHNDNGWCRPFVQTLYDAGVDVWYDEKGLSGGAEWMAQIEDQLQQRDFFLLVLTPDAWASDWVQREIRLATITRRIIIPLMVKTTPISGFLLTVQYVPCEAISEHVAAQRVIELIRVPATPGASAPAMVPPPGQQAALRPPMARLILPSEFTQYKYQPTVIGGFEVIMPPMCVVSAGEFIMGSSSGDSAPQCLVDLPAFSIGRFPVTVAEYLCALRAKAVSEPVDWKGQRNDLAKPVVGVSWVQAKGYAAWLAQVTSSRWRLPTEAEWEKASRGTDGRRWPWVAFKNEYPYNPLTPSHYDGAIARYANVGRYSGDGRTARFTPSALERVFSTTATNSGPYGTINMLGNIWEWTSSLHHLYPYDGHDGRENPSDLSSQRVLRGGSYSSGGAVTAFTRLGYAPTMPADDDNFDYDDDEELDARVSDPNAPDLDGDEPEDLEERFPRPREIGFRLVQEP